MHLTEDEMDRFAVNRWRFPGVDVVPYLTRRYPLGPLLAHVVGYVGRIDTNDLERLDPELYQGTSHVGRSGIERSYEDVLHGTPGYELDEVNADGRIQRVLETHPPMPGKNLYLSIDVRIQKAAAAAFDGRPVRRWCSTRAMARCWRWSASPPLIPTCLSTASARPITAR